MALKITQVTGGVVLELDGVEIRSYPKGQFCLHRDVNDGDHFLITKGNMVGDVVFDFRFDDVTDPVAVDADALYTAIRPFFFPDVANDNGPVEGIEGSIQYNDGGKLGGDGNFLYDKDVSALTVGNRTGTLGQFSFALGQLSSAANDGTYAGGWVDNAAPAVLADAPAAFNHSYNTAAQTPGHGAKGVASAIIGGINGNVPFSSSRSVVIGGSGLKMPENTPDTVMVPDLIVDGTIISTGAILDMVQVNGLVSALEGKLSRGGDTSVDSAVFNFPRAALSKQLGVNALTQEFSATDTLNTRTTKMTSDGLEFSGSDGNMLAQYVGTMKLLRFYTTNSGRGINIFGPGSNGSGGWLTFGDHFANDPLNPYAAFREKGGTDTDALQAHGKNGFYVTTGTDVNATAAFFVNPSGNVGVGTESQAYRLDVQGGDINVSGNFRKSGTVGYITSAWGGVLNPGLVLANLRTRTLTINGVTVNVVVNP